MNPFDLSHYEALKKRADESARDPQPLPRELVMVNWHGQPTPLELQQVLLDGDKQFVMFSPPELPGDCFFVGAPSHRDRKDIWNERVMSALCLSNFVQRFGENEWTERAVEALEKGAFGRMRVQEHEDDSATVDFFGSNGYLFSWDYIEYDDGLGPLRAAMASPEYDPTINGTLWCDPDLAHTLLLSLTEAEVFALVNAPDEQVSETMKLERRWPTMSHEERRTFLPKVELELEEEILALMRAILWSDPHWNDEEFATKHADFRALWRQPRFCLALCEGGAQSDFQWNLGTDSSLLMPRRRRLWNLVGNEMLKRLAIQLITSHICGDTSGGQLQKLRRFEATILAAILSRLPRRAMRSALASWLFENSTLKFAPCVANWMRVRGGYIVQIIAPTRHEQLEASLLLRDFLAQMGHSLEKLESECILNLP